jgi:hypothetical protein
MAHTNPYMQKIALDLVRTAKASKKVSRFLALRTLAAERGLAVCRLMCCGHDCASYFFYRLDDTKAADGGYTVSGSYTQLNPDAPRGVPSEFETHYREVARAEGLDAAFAFLETVEG